MNSNVWTGALAFAGLGCLFSLDFWASIFEGVELARLLFVILWNFCDIENLFVMIMQLHSAGPKNLLC